MRKTFSASIIILMFFQAVISSLMQPNRIYATESIVISSSDLTASLAESVSALNFGNTINFTVTADGGTKPYTYAWYVDNQLVNTTDSPYYKTNSLNVGNHHVYVTVKDARGNSVNTLAVSFEVLPLLSYSPSPSPTKPTKDDAGTENILIALIIGTIFIVAIVSSFALIKRYRN